MNKQLTRNQFETYLVRLAMLAALLSISVFGQAAVAADLAATDARIVLPKGESITMPGYVTLENLTDKEIILIKIRSVSFELSMIHQAINDRGNLRMTLKPELLIKPKAKVVLKPGDVHFMFAGAKKDVRKGQVVSVDMYLNTGEKMPVEFRVVK